MNARYLAMKDILLGLLMAAVLTLAAFALSPPTHDLQSGQNALSGYSTLQD